jgi:hypothetical protein
MRSATTTRPVAMPIRNGKAVPDGASSFVVAQSKSARTHWALGIVLVCLRVAEIGEDAVAHVSDHFRAAAGVMLLEGEEWLQVLAIARKRRGQWDRPRWMKKGLRNMPHNGNYSRHLRF